MYMYFNVETNCGTWIMSYTQMWTQTVIHGFKFYICVLMWTQLWCDTIPIGEHFRA